mgnify:CR=1 FL=1
MTLYYIAIILHFTSSSAMVFRRYIYQFFLLTTDLGVELLPTSLNCAKSVRHRKAFALVIIDYLTSNVRV